ncbi:MAG: glucose 1-dehydrogenase [Pseudomonadota bacterium]
MQASTPQGLEAFSLKGKTALVTGAGAGIGAACAEALAQAGAQVMATDIDGAAAEALAAKAAEQGLAMRAMAQDVVKPEEWEEVVGATLSAFGGWEILVNNAGIFVGELTVAAELEELRRVNQVNVESVFLGTKAAAKAMQPGGPAGKGGSVINLSSIAGLIGAAGVTAYGASKGAVRSYSKHAAVEFGALGYGIRVNSVHPGVIETQMGDNLFDRFVAMQLAPDVATARESFMGSTPVGRFGHPADIANAVLFLASDASSFINGAELVIDGGLTAS